MAVSCRWVYVSEWSQLHVIHPSQICVLLLFLMWCVVVLVVSLLHRVPCCIGDSFVSSALLFCDVVISINLYKKIARHKIPSYCCYAKYSELNHSWSCVLSIFLHPFSLQLSLVPNSVILDHECHPFSHQTCMHCLHNVSFVYRYCCRCWRSQGQNEIRGKTRNIHRGLASPRCWSKWFTLR